jgi:hypothetical protein
MVFQPPAKIWHPRILFLIFFLNTFIWTFLFFHPSTFDLVGSYIADDELLESPHSPSPSLGDTTPPSKDSSSGIPNSMEPTHEETVPTSAHENNTTSGWSFDVARDSKKFDLNDEQCDVAFPGLFLEIERAVAYRKTIGQVKLEEIDISSEEDVATGGVVRAMIIDQQVRNLFIHFLIPISFSITSVSQHEED